MHDTTKTPPWKMKALGVWQAKSLSLCKSIRLVFDIYFPLSKLISFYSIVMY